MDRAAKVAVRSFYVFALMLPSAGFVDGGRRLYMFALASAAVLWWYADSVRRGIQVPVMSLWIGLVGWYFVLPVHVLTTRGRRGLWRLAFHAGIVLLLLVVGAAGAALASMMRAPL